MYVARAVQQHRPARQRSPGSRQYTEAILPCELTEGQMAKNTKTTKTTTQTEKPVSKQNQVLALLRRQDGASIAEMCAATGWQAHSARGFLSGALKKRLKINVVSEKNEAGERRYFVAAIKSPE